MATTEKKKFKKKLFKVARELNVSTDRVVEFLEDQGYAEALSGDGFNASITDEEAYLVLRKEYADDAEAAERVRELREEQDGSATTVSQDEVASLDKEPEDAADAESTGEAEAEAPEPAQADAADAEAAETGSAEATGAEATDADASSADASSADASSADASGAETSGAEASGAEPSDVEAAETGETATSEQAEASGDGMADAETTADAEAQAETEGAAKANTESGEAEPTAESAAADAKVTEEPADAVSEADVSDEPDAEATADAEATPKAEAQAETEGAAKADTEPGEAEPTAESAAADAEATEEPADAVSEADVSDEPEAEATADAEASSDTEAKAEAEAQADTEAEADTEEASADPVKTAAEGETEYSMEPSVDAPIDTDREALEADDIEDVEDTDDEEQETLKANRYRLSGTQVVGKVDLSQLQRPKRKRKRKKKDDDKDEKSRKDRKSKKKKKKKKKQKKKRRSKNKGVDEEDVEATIQETLQELEQGASRARQRRRRRRRQRHEQEREERRRQKKAQEGILRVTEFVTTGELANLMGEPVSDVIGMLFDAGMMVSINQRLDRETIEFVADEYDMDVEFVDEVTDTSIEVREDDPDDLGPRAPVVTVMGHVDHGKTSLLDYIRNANVVAGEEGGITQHIGAHRVTLSDFEDAAITFLDTPGHEAFTAMRARGAKATDIVVLVVAADDSVMPQTIEAINHAQAADVPIVVAINKMDKQEADAQRVMAELAEHNVLVEQYGGSVQVAEVSAETGQNIDDLLEKIVLQAEIMELQANPDREASGVIIESRLEKGRGNVITVLVQNGTLEVGDPFVAGIHSGSVRAMFDERDNRVQEAGPATPVLVLGCDGSPEVGDQFVVMNTEGEARDIAAERQRIHREQELRRKSQVSLDQVSRRMAEGEFHELNLIVKGDVGGSVEALSDALLKLKTDEVAVNIVHSGVGAVTESDVMLARASDAVIIGFQVRPTTGARKMADQEEVDIRTYSIIYDAIEDVHDALEGLLSPEEREETKGRVEVRETFKVPNVGTVAGCYVTDGTISRNHQVRVIRDGVVMYEGEIDSLKRFQDDVKEVQSGYECGMSVKNFNDVKVGDEFETYVVIEEKRTLEV